MNKKRIEWEAEQARREAIYNPPGQRSGIRYDTEHPCGRPAKGEQVEYYMITQEPCDRCRRLIYRMRGRNQLKEAWLYSTRGMSARMPVTLCFDCCQYKPVQHDQKACESCGEMFQPKRTTARFCGGTCRQRAARAKA